MKTTIFLPLALVLALSSCNISNEKGNNGIFNFSTKEGKGSLKDKTFTGNFDEIKVSQAIQAEVVKSNEEKVVITAPEDILSEILVENNGGKLHIHFKPNLNISANRVSAKIYAKDFSRLSANSAASIQVKDQFTQDKTFVDVSSSGSVSGNLEANQFSIETSSSGGFSGKIWAVNLVVQVSSSGDVDVTGKAKNVSAEASSAGSFNAGDLVAENANLQASSGGSVKIGVSGTASAHASSGGDINIVRKGNLKVAQQNTSSGGSISIQ